VTASDLVSVILPHCFNNDNEFDFDNISNQQDTCELVTIA